MVQSVSYTDKETKININCSIQGEKILSIFFYYRSSHINSGLEYGN